MTTPTGHRVGLAGWYVARGRIGRSRWWLRYLLVFLALGIAATWADRTFYPGAAAVVVDADEHGRGLLWPWLFPVSGGPVTGITGLLLLVPQVSGMVARLHDRDHSAWWLLWTLLPVIGWIVLVVTVCLLGSTATTNPYGPPPH